jgi:hypothetical protein
MISVTTLTIVAQTPSVFRAECMASTTILDVDSPNNSLSCWPMNVSADSAPTTHPIAATAMTSSGAIENAL